MRAVSRSRADESERATGLPGRALRDNQPPLRRNAELQTVHYPDGYRVELLEMAGR
ncbi:MAG: hypothetical protein ACYDHT_04085 [Solirubrobacteraceae bacterium]